MTVIEEKRSLKLPCYTSLFFKLGFFDKVVFDSLVQDDECYFNQPTQTFEFPVSKFGFLVKLLTKYDNIDYKPFIEQSQLNLSYNEKTKTKDYSLYKHQIEGIEYGLNHNGWLLLDDQGLGKAFSLDTPVLTEFGYKNMSDISIGDSVFDENGDKCKVTATYNHDSLEMYKITFSDGKDMICCKDHLWQVVYRKHQKLKGERKARCWEVSECHDTSWLIDNDRYKKYRMWIPLCKPIKFSEKNLPIDPYIVGFLLGDGGLTQHSATFSTTDEEIIDRISSLLPEGYVVKNKSKSLCNFSIIKNSSNFCKNNSIVENLKDLHLMGCGSSEKFVPDIYKYGSVEQRYALIQGYLDADGYASKDNLLQFSTASEQLMEDITFIVESLGGMVTGHVKNTRYKMKDGNYKECKKSYTGTIRIECPQKLLSLERKKSRLSTRKFKPVRRIVSIEKVNNMPGKCISVDSKSHLYVANHCVVTHNTAQIIKLAEYLYKKKEVKHCFIICGVNSLKYNWASEIEKFCNLDYTILGQKVSKNGKITISSVSERLLALKKGIKEFFIITNIETLQHKDFYKNFNDSKSSYDMVILDEAHKAKNPTSKASKNLLKLKADRKIALTGTLILNNPSDAYVALKWTNNVACTYGQFKNFYDIKGGFACKQVIGHKNLDVLNSLVSKCSLRRLKSEVLDLPDKTYIKEYVDLLPNQRKLYDTVSEGIAAELDLLKNQKITIAQEIAINMRLRQITAYPGMLSSEVVDSSKLNRLYELVEQITAQGDKVVIFNTFKGTADKEFEDLAQFNPLLCTGDQSDEEIDKSKKLFQEDPNYKIMICTWQKMGTGHTLTAANYAIFVDTPWTDGEFQQCADRIYRIGQGKKVFIITLITKDTYDERVQELIDNKENISNIILK